MYPVFYFNALLKIKKYIVKEKFILNKDNKCNHGRKDTKLFESPVANLKKISYNYLCCYCDGIVITSCP